MEWWEFFERYQDWSGLTQRVKLSQLREMGTGEEVAIVVRHMQDAQNKKLLLHKAMHYGVRFSSAQLDALDGDLPPELAAELREYAGLPQWQPWERL